MTRIRVGIVYPSGHLFNTPCVTNLAERMAAEGFDVTVYCVNNLAAPTGSFSKKITVKRLPFSQKKSAERVGIISVLFLFWLANRLWKDRPAVLIASGARGLFVVGALSLLWTGKFVYNSLEIYSGQAYSGIAARCFKLLECFFNKRAVFSITQDLTRAELLGRVNRLQARKILTFPNAPAPNGRRRAHRAKQVELRARLGIACDSRILLYAGSLLSNWGGVNEILGIAEKLPAGWTLVLQARMVAQPPQHPRFQALLRSGQLVWSAEPLSMEDYSILVSTAEIGLAWYESDEENIRLVGLSSGKISQYWALGKPVILNKLPLYDDVIPKYHAGRLVRTMEEIPQAVLRVSENYDEYAMGAARAFDDLFDIVEPGKAIAAELHSCLAIH